MSITLNDLELPNGLRWIDEYTWTPVVQNAEYSLTGAMVIEEAIKLAGRPMTLLGGDRFAWIRRSALNQLKALLDIPTPSLTLTLHDNRQFVVIPDRNNSYLEISPLPLLYDSGPSDPIDDTWYVVNNIHFLILSEITN
ncbi:hypothetical protein HUU62_08605 [Rhodoferax sp. 4810]|uniref:Uncharacterized protein n=1 Tax=Thiospirillum jenense TaxID=1653858 RepID=A0A839HEU4_9GAMM|nr:hypothetical protein [Thiospirillum jenense]MBB1074469.1 hypothetical protein [Rhodoferax jenense]MBB1125549.1 hypothetical protein [Thiospirillum jenense]